jgi:hypothetical protein
MTTGPGLYSRIQHRFAARQMEWLMAIITFNWGVVLLLPDDIFQGNSWIIFRAIAPENWWGVLFLLCGLARIGGLVVNGARRTITPWIRITAAFLGLLIWVGICFGFALAGVPGIWRAVYPAFALAEVVNLYRAAHDAGESRGHPTA